MDLFDDIDLDTFDLIDPLDVFDDDLSRLLAAISELSELSLKSYLDSCKYKPNLLLKPFSDLLCLYLLLEDSFLCFICLNACFFLITTFLIFLILFPLPLILKLILIFDN